MRISLLAISLLVLSGCTVRNVDTKMTPQLYANGDVVYMYSDLANFAQPHNDKEAEANRLKDLNEWVLDAALCPSGYEVIKRQVILNRANSEGGKVYYFIKCKN